MKINPDMFYSLAPAEAVRLAFRAITQFQQKPEHLIASVAIILLMVCKLSKVRVHQALESAGRMLRDAEYADHGGHYFALENYIQKEVLDD